MRVLIVEDDPYLADAIRVGLRRETIAADMVHDGVAALEAVASENYEIVILDRDLPGVHGDEVCATLAKDHPLVRILMLTGARTLNDRVTGFELGADDYLSKPFEFPELVARLRALERRSQPASPPVLDADGIRLDAFRREVYRYNRLVRLSPKEFAVLHTLMKADGGVLGPQTLLEQAWDANTDPFTNTVRVTVSNLRKRLGQPWVIQTIPGIGYRFGAAG